MNEKHRYRFAVKSDQPPTIEIDPSASALYVRFRREKVARTIPNFCPNGVVTLDLTKDNEVIGIEAIGMDGLSIKGILEKAGVRVPRSSLENAPMRWAGLKAAAAA